VTAPLNDGQVVIRYDGWEASSDEIATRDCVLLAPRGQPAPAENAQPVSAPPGRPVDAQTPLAPGDPVHIEYQSAYYPGRVVAVLSTGALRVHYLGWGNESDENVPRERLRVGVPRLIVVHVAATAQRR
jgi:hypothetical protein